MMNIIWIKITELAKYTNWSSLSFSFRSIWLWDGDYEFHTTFLLIILVSIASVRNTLRMDPSSNMGWCCGSCSITSCEGPGERVHYFQASRLNETNVARRPNPVEKRSICYFYDVTIDNSNVICSTASIGFLLISTPKLTKDVYTVLLYSVCINLCGRQTLLAFLMDVWFGGSVRNWRWKHLTMRCSSNNNTFHFQLIVLCVNVTCWRHCFQIGK